jgi:GH18 family chitinase
MPATNQRQLKLSIDLSRHFSNLTATASSRERFAQVLVQFAKKHGFHGIEIDWECEYIRFELDYVSARLLH